MGVAQVTTGEHEPSIPIEGEPPEGHTEPQIPILGDSVYERALTNAIGYEIFKHDHEVTPNEQGVDHIVISDEETERCRNAARRVIEELRLLGVNI